MGENTFRYQADGSAGTYWRRRFTVLVVGLAVFAVAAWGLSSTLRVSPGGRDPSQAPGGQGSAGRTEGGAAGHAGSGTRHGSGSGKPAGSGSAGSGSAGSGKAGSGKAGTGKAGMLAGGGSTGKSSGAGGNGRNSGNGKSQSKSANPQILPIFCGRRDIVLSLSTTQDQFGARQPPAFSLNVVSTQQAECSFNVGQGHLALVIKEGPARVWSSADCARGPGGLITALKRGVPTVLAIGWNRETSSPGCSGRVRQVPVGVYTAYAVEGSLVSAPVTFRLS